MKNLTPRGYCEITDVFNQLGQIHYGDVWTGAELSARQLPGPDEIKAKRQEAARNYEEWKREAGVTASMQPDLGKPPGHFIEVNPYMDESLPDPNNEEYLSEREARERRDEIEHQLIGHLYSGAPPAYLKDQYGEFRALPNQLWQSRELSFHLISNAVEWWRYGQVMHSGGVFVKTVDAEKFIKAVEEGAPVPDYSTGGRRPNSSSRATEIHEMFDAIAKAQSFTFKRGEKTRIAEQIATKIGYKSDSVRRVIAPTYDELKDKKQRSS